MISFNESVLYSAKMCIRDRYEVVHEHARATVLQYSGIVKTMRFDDEFYYDGNDLGYTYSIEETSFALWAPTAYRVKLEITKNEITHTYDMQRRERGVFRYCVHEDLENACLLYTSCTNNN